VYVYETEGQLLVLHRRPFHAAILTMLLSTLLLVHGWLHAATFQHLHQRKKRS
jgi:hypothetical protein